MKFKRSEIGVVVGRFQVDELTEGHIELLLGVHAHHDRVIVLLGSSPVLGDKRNPLDFPTRAAMIREGLPQATVLPLHDLPSDEAWSESVDAMVRGVYPLGGVTVYGGRDSFIPHYSGAFDCMEVPTSGDASGTATRRKIGHSTLTTAAERRGAIYATMNNYPRAFPCADAAIVNEDRDEVLLVRKWTDGVHWRFPGGFANPRERYEHTAHREVREEIGCEIHVEKSLGSFVVDDWRYPEGDGITTTLFLTKYLHGPVGAADDICEAKWFRLDRLPPIVDSHKPMMEAVINELSPSD